jgi:hypothetical protein
MQMTCQHCKAVLMKKNSNKYKTTFTCRRPDCPNYNKDVLVKKVIVKA